MIESHIGTDLEESEKEIVGFSIYNKNLELRLPKFYQTKTLSKEEIKEELFAFYRIFQKYSAEKRQRSVKPVGNSKYVTNLQTIEMNKYSILELYFSLLIDYIENGLLLFNENTTNLKPKGRINWSRTLSKSQGLLVNDEVIFNKYIYNNLCFDFRHPITILYACALMNIDRLLNLKLELPYNYVFLRSFENSEQNIANILRKFRRKMFSDRHKKIFAILENIYLSKDRIKNIAIKGQEVHYTETFHTIWERMIKVALFDEMENIFAQLSYPLPTGEFAIDYCFIQQDGCTYPGLKLIPDTILTHNHERDKYLIIIDAKNYFPNFLELKANPEISPKGMPKTPDIVKQLFYRYFLSKDFNQDKGINTNKILNVFLLPTLNEEKINIEYIGRHRFIAPFENLNFGDILCFNINFINLRNQYLTPNPEYKKNIIKVIVDKYLHR